MLAIPGNLNNLKTAFKYYFLYGTNNRTRIILNKILAVFWLSENDTKSVHGGTCAFSDPEYLKNQFSYKRHKNSDTYSLGVLFWDLSSGVPPYKNIELADIVQKVISGERETPIDGIPIDFMKLYHDAWNNDPNLRPNIAEIRHKLNNIQIAPVYHSNQNINADVSSIGLAELLEDNSNDAVLLRNRGIAYNKLGRYDEALVYLTNSLKIEPENTFVLKIRAGVYMLLCRFEEAIADFNHFLKIIPNDAEVLGFRDAAYRMIGRYDEALADSNRLLAINPDDAVSLSGSYDESQESPLELTLRCRGSTYYEMGRYEESLSDFNKALKIRPNSEFALLGRGKTYRKMNRYEESLVDLNKLLEIKPNDSFSLQERGITYRMMKKYEESLDDLHESLKINQYNSFALGECGA
ncbi:hypothetical protein C2G38_2145680 [Gigaspora rosea]|uniref:Protein kinase domain-containing protein n=1 Tax=Gigaspora rosea TaxID=44941 RepID=A0A397UM56_9GLOM|nr:hypothetical protein C2G38_2145680 [Gigaspora rosea]